jgi:hypothetical protein
MARAGHTAAIINTRQQNRPGIRIAGEATSPKSCKLKSLPDADSPQMETILQKAKIMGIQRKT